jgi:hypothetical protein
MSIHIFGLTVAALVRAAHAARRADHTVTLVDHVSQVTVVVDQRGRMTVRAARACDEGELAVGEAPS